MISISGLLIVTLTGRAFVCGTPRQSILIAIHPDSTLFSVIRRCNSFDCDFLGVILFVALPSNIFD